MSQEPGILAVWNDCDRTREAEYETGTATSICPSASACRASVSAGATRPSAAPARVSSPTTSWMRPAYSSRAPYLERSNNPTPWTRKIMGEQIFRNINRTACRQAWRIGALRGAYVLAMRWTDAAAVAAAVQGMRTPAADLIENGAAVRAEFWQAVAEGTGTRSVEQSLRSGDDKSIAGALLIEATRDRDLAEASRRSPPWRGRAPDRCLSLAVRADRRDMAG